MLGGQARQGHWNFHIHADPMPFNDGSNALDWYSMPITFADIHRLRFGERYARKTVLKSARRVEILYRISVESGSGSNGWLVTPYITPEDLSVKGMRDREFWPLPSTYAGSLTPKPYFTEADLPLTVTKTIPGNVHHFFLRFQRTGAGTNVLSLSVQIKVPPIGIPISAHREGRFSFDN